MAKKEKVKSEGKKSNKKLILIVVISIIIGISSFVIWKFVFDKDAPKTVVQIKELDNLEEYNYTLTDKDTKYFESEYEILKDLLTKDEVDEEKYVTQVARMFTIDLYTMSTKVNKYDVGGIEYYYVTNKKMYEQKVIDTLYSSMLDDTYGDRKQELPEIKNIETISIEKINYMLGDKEVTGYLVKLEMEYVKDLGYDTEASLIVCKEDGNRWSVVDFQPTLKPVYK